MDTPIEVASALSEAVLSGNLERAADLIAPNAIDHSPLPDAPPGIEGWRAKWDALTPQLAAVQTTPAMKVADGDHVCTRYETRAPDGTPLGFALEMLRVSDGKVVEHWALPMPAA